MGIKLNINGETSDKIAERRTSGDYDLMFNQTWGLLFNLIPIFLNSACKYSACSF
jgi:hypothetical protein